MRRPRRWRAAACGRALRALPGAPGALQGPDRRGGDQVGPTCQQAAGAMRHRRAAVRCRGGGQLSRSGCAKVGRLRAGDGGPRRLGQLADDVRCHHASPQAVWQRWQLRGLERGAWQHWSGLCSWGSCCGGGCG